MRTIRWLCHAGMIALLCAGPVHAQVSDADLSFDKFLKSVRDTNSLDKVPDKQTAKVRDAKGLDAMRGHVLKHYDGVVVKHSFLDAANNPVDCVTIESQPSLRQGAKTLMKPPKPASIDTAAAKKADDRVAAAIPAQLDKDKKDRLGNAQYCAAGTIPTMRLTLDRMVRFETLDRFLGKNAAPNNAKTDKAQRDTSLQDSVGFTHRWAHGYQPIANHGGESYVNLWQPNRGPGFFSLVQHWYVGGTGDARQTVEGGLIVSQRYPDNDTHLFIFYTNKNYANNSGCWDLDCTGFVQTNPNWVIGGVIRPVSSRDGPQYDIRMQWQYWQGNWWLYLQGGGAFEAVGYYPGSLFGSGQMSRGAQSVDYGGEVSTEWNASATGQMGSGALASEGWKRAAYQRNIFYIDAGQVSRMTTLNPTGDTCYTIDLHNQSGGAGWGTYMFLGGPRCP